MTTSLNLIIIISILKSYFYVFRMLSNFLTILPWVMTWQFLLFYSVKIIRLESTRAPSISFITLHSLNLHSLVPAFHRIPCYFRNQTIPRNQEVVPRISVPKKTQSRAASVRLLGLQDTVRRRHEDGGASVINEVWQLTIIIVSGEAGLICRLLHCSYDHGSSWRFRMCQKIR